MCKCWDSVHILRDKNKMKNHPIQISNITIPMWRRAALTGKVIRETTIRNNYDICPETSIYLSIKEKSVMKLIFMLCPQMTPLCSLLLNLSIDRVIISIIALRKSRYWAGFSSFKWQVTILTQHKILEGKLHFVTFCCCINMWNYDKCGYPHTFFLVF